MDICRIAVVSAARPLVAITNENCRVHVLAFVSVAVKVTIISKVRFEKMIIPVNCYGSRGIKLTSASFFSSLFTW